MVLAACSSQNLKTSLQPVDLYGQWEADKRLTFYSNCHDYGSCNNAWTIAVRDTMVHIVWGHRVIRGGANPGKLYYIKSINSGSIFEPDKQLTTGKSFYPSVAVCDSIVHIVWIDTRDGKGEIYYKRSVDDGATWGIEERLTNDPAYSEHPSVAVCDSIVHIVWIDTRDDNYEIYYKRSVDNGANWGIEERLTNDPAPSTFPSVAVCDSIVHVVWYDERDGNKEIYYKRSVDNGATWGIEEKLTNNNEYSQYPSVAVRDSIVHVVWYDWRNGNYEIYYNRSVDNGATWEIDERLTNNNNYSQYPSVAVRDSIVHIVWIDTRDGNGKIYYKRSVDNGATWGADERLTNAAVLANHVSVACWDCSYGYDVSVAWTDERDGNQEIYYKRHKCEGASVEESEELKVKSLELRVFPNPSFGNAMIKYGLPERADIRLGLYDISGRLVKTIYSGTAEKGYHTVRWNGKNKYGKKVASGIYFYKLEAGNYIATKKIYLIR